MNQRSAEVLLRCFHPETEESRLRKAVRFAQKNAALKEPLRRQIAFDERVTAVLAGVKCPPSLRDRMRLAKPKRNLWLALRHPAFLSAFFGVIVVVALVVYTGMQRAKTFPGKDAVVRMIHTTDDMSGVELEPISIKGAKLEDWIFLKFALDHYSLPGEFAAVDVAGCRVFQQDGLSVAQAALKDHQAIAFIFRAADFRVQPNRGERWAIFHDEEWAAGIRKDGQNCVVVAFRGTEEEMSDFLRARTK
ncbi:MAG: hypothetical protein M3O82_08955 [Verrucomicrobiota bacterium]|nr:hypothetical protein [Verrucomicrobiota bacterium]